MIFGYIEVSCRSEDTVCHAGAVQRGIALEGDGTWCVPTWPLQDEDTKILCR